MRRGMQYPLVGCSRHYSPNSSSQITIFSKIFSLASVSLRHLRDLNIVFRFDDNLKCYLILHECSGQGSGLYSLGGLGLADYSLTCFYVALSVGHYRLHQICGIRLQITF